MGLKATVLYVDGSITTHVFDGEDPPLRWMQSIVGGLIAFVPNPTCSVVVNDAASRLQLPLNDAATELYGNGASLHGNVIVIDLLEAG